MSAFICSDRVYKDIYSGFVQFNDTIQYPHTCRVIRQIREYAHSGFVEINRTAPLIAELYALNVEAVNIRYGVINEIELTKKRIIDICTDSKDISIYQFLKSLECLQYQMSEVKVRNSELYSLIDELIKAVSCDIAHTSNLYNMAKWG